MKKDDWDISSRRGRKTYMPRRHARGIGGTTYGGGGGDMKKRKEDGGHPRRGGKLFRNRRLIILTQSRTMVEKCKPRTCGG